MKPLRILQVNNRIPWPLNDGGNLAVHNLTRYLHLEGHHVELACLNTMKHHQDPSVIREVAAVHAVDIDTTVTLWGAFKAQFGSLPYNIARFLSLEFSELLQHLLTTKQFDLVQLEGSYMSLYLPAIKAVTEAPVILRSHNIEHQIWQRLAAKTPNLLKRIYLKNMARGIRKFELDHLLEHDAIIPITRQDEDFYRAAGFAGPMRTISGGVDLADFTPKVAPVTSLKIAFLGSLEWMPNLDGLAWFVDEVWPQVRAAHPMAELHVAGKNPPPHLAEWDVPGMTFHGMVPNAAEFMESCFYFIVPLHAGGGMRLKIVEAMAMERCVVSTSIGAEGIEAVAGKELVIVDGAEEWIRTLNALLADPAGSLQIARAGQDRALDDFAMDTVFKQLMAFYGEVLG